jgi:hypothetical protein
MTRTRDIEVLLPLSPLQEGLLFHSLADAGSGIYVEQLTCVLEGALDESAFEHAWQRRLGARPGSGEPGEHGRRAAAARGRR